MKIAVRVPGVILAVLSCGGQLFAQTPPANPTNAANPTSSPSPSPSPSPGVTGGSSPIEATLFAYRALASDADAIAFELARSGGDKIVIGTQADVTAFAQWRQIMGEGDLLHNRAVRILMLKDPKLSLKVHHPGGLTPNAVSQAVDFRITVSNGSSTSAGQTTGPVTVTLDDKWTDFTLVPSPGWQCVVSSRTCTNSAVLQPGSALPTLEITVPLILPNAAARDGYSFKVTAATAGSTKSWQDRLAAPKLDLVKNAVGTPPGEVKFTMTVSNAADAGSTTDQVTVTDLMPEGWTVGTSWVGGDGWACVVPAPVNNRINIICQRSDPLAPGKPYPLITLDALTTSTDPNQATATTAGSVVAQSHPSEGGNTLFAGPAPEGGINAGEAIVSSGVEILTSLAGLFAVTQTLTPAPVSITDAPLIKLVSGHLSGGGISVYVPSVFIPNLLQNARLSDTYLWWSLSRLEKDRIDLMQVSANAAAAKALITNIDTFENSLFGGQVLTQPATTNTSNKPGGTPGDTTPPSTCVGGTCIAINNAQPAAAQDTSATKPNTQQNNGAQTPPPPVLNPQILAADLTVRALWGNLNYSIAAESDFARIKFLSLQSLEAGGTRLTKSSKIVGDHIFFSGGAIASYSLFNFGGDVACAGIAYDYEGNIREKNYDRALRTPQLPAILSPEVRCAPSKSQIMTSFEPLLNKEQIKTDMPIGEVFAKFGKANRRTEESNGAFVYQFRNPGDANKFIDVTVKNGKVTAVVDSRMPGAADISIGMTVSGVVGLLGPRYQRYESKNGISIYEFDNPSDADSYIVVAFENGRVKRRPATPPKNLVGRTVDQVTAALGQGKMLGKRSGIIIYRFDDPTDPEHYDIEVAFKNGAVIRTPERKPKPKK